jgi:toxin FitB
VSYLLDTNVVSEWTKPRPNPGVIEWLSQVAEDEVFLSVVTFAELRHGIEWLAAGRRRRRLDEWLRGELALRFEGRIVLIDGAIADEWGRLVARQEARGRPIAAMDGLIAATAQVHALTLVTRNATDFRVSVKAVLNPWKWPAAQTEAVAIPGGSFAVKGCGSVRRAGSEVHSVAKHCKSFHPDAVTLPGTAGTWIVWAS